MLVLVDEEVSGVDLVFKKEIALAANMRRDSKSEYPRFHDNSGSTNENSWRR